MHYSEQADQLTFFDEVVEEITPETVAKTTPDVSEIVDKIIAQKPPEDETEDDCDPEFANAVRNHGLVTMDVGSSNLWYFDGDENLLASGIDATKIVRVGNIMIDTLVAMKPAVESSRFLESIPLQNASFSMVTLHRPSNVDEPATLHVLLDELLIVAQQMDLIWPLHPRTKARIEALGRMDELLEHDAVHLMGPLGYIDFMNGIMHSKCVITDSGGIQEETTWLGVPCITLRPNTERPITITQGTNVLATPTTLQSELGKIENQSGSLQTQIEFWDGRTAQRCVQSLEQFLER